MWADTLLIVFISICTAFLGEGDKTQINVYENNSNSFIISLTGLTWLLVYRTEKFQKLKGEVEKQSKKCKFFSVNQTSFVLILTRNVSILVERRKEIHGDSLDKQHKKKIERDEEKLKNNNRDLSLVKMKSMFATGFAFTALLSMFNSM